MAFAVTVTVKYNFKHFEIYDDAAADQCEDANGKILNREGDAGTKFAFSAKEDKNEKPPGQIVVSGSLEEIDAGGNKVWKDYSREYPLNYGKLEFLFPELPFTRTSQVIHENVDFDDFIIAIGNGLQSLKPARRKPKNGGA